MSSPYVIGQALAPNIKIMFLSNHLAHDYWTKRGLRSKLPVMKSISQTDILVVGAGPVGLFAVFACGQLGLRSHLVDALDGPGGQCTALYPMKPIYDVPAFPEVSGKELIDRLLTQMKPYQPPMDFHVRVQELESVGGRWHATLTDGSVIDASAVIIAAGAGAFGPNRPPLQDIEKFEPDFVRYAVVDPAEFAGRHVVVAGGGDSAVDWAVELSSLAAHVHVVHRRDKFRASPAMVSRMKELALEGRISLHVPGQLAGLKGEHELTHVVVRDAQHVEHELPASHLLAFYGLKSDLSDISSMGIQVAEGGIPVVPTSMATNLAGVFAVGDVARYDNKLKLILTGFSEASIAAHQAFAHVYPGRALSHEHSTSKGAPTGFSQ